MTQPAARKRVQVRQSALIHSNALFFRSPTLFVRSTSGGIVPACHACNTIHRAHKNSTRAAVTLLLECGIQTMLRRCIFSTSLRLSLLSLQFDPFHTAMEHHTDWVNDIVLCCNGRNCKR